jgi:transposase-like protein
MNFQEFFEDYQKSYEQMTDNELREFRIFLIKILQLLNKKLDSIVEKAGGNKARCPHCRSNNTKGHGRNPIKRFYCLDCKQTFPESISRLYYRKRNRIKILDFIVAIYTTDKGISQITHELNISIQTYYKWKKDILIVFPQLEEKFNRKRGKK